MSKLKILVWFVICILSFTHSQAQHQSSKVKKDVYVDKEGVMRWGDSKQEVNAFGVNYTMPFAYGYRAAKQLNISIENVIDNDIYHFARLGFDAYRVHVWDCEISDTLGNLLSNEHLKLFDYTIAKMKERGMKFLITPLAYWGNGWPEPDEKTPGFSTKYGKGNCLTNPDAIKAQEIYLYQFLNHVNPYTGQAYKSDPDVIAFEISNEPHHDGAPETVTKFINKMVKAMRDTGCKKPILYNISHSIHLMDAYMNSDIQGGTFQWYPTGLNSRHELVGNLLPNVDKYTMPFANHPKFKKKAKVIYEFDAADVGRSYIYPAMARSFREAGMQVATQFAYDPTFTAYANTEYGTHYMNLIYAPQKGLSLKIAAEVFHAEPLYKKFGNYPANTSFDGFKISYKEDLAEMVTDKKFFYTNNTTSLPASVQKLEHIAGYGNSSVVAYEGVGAYFLDRLEDGVWRLEVMPDAIWVNDPFEKTSLKREVSVLNWRSWPISISLPNLGEEFNVKAINETNTTNINSTGRSFKISPGTYLLTKKGVTTKITGADHWQNITLKEFFAPASSVKKTYVLHKPVNEISTGRALTIEAKIISREEPSQVKLYFFTEQKGTESITMERTSGYNYKAVVGEEFVRPGFIHYYIAVNEKNQWHTYPSGLETNPHDWDFFDNTPYSVKVISNTLPLYIFDASTDTHSLSRQWLWTSSLIPLAETGKAEAHIVIENLAFKEYEKWDKDIEVIPDYSFRYSFKNKILGRVQDASTKKEIVLKGRSLTSKPCLVQVALITKDATAYGGVISVAPEINDYRFNIADLKKVKLVSLPRPYPSFLPYYFLNDLTNPLDLNEIESIQFSIGPGIPQGDLQGKYSVAIESVRLE